MAIVFKASPPKATVPGDCLVINSGKISLVPGNCPPNVTVSERGFKFLNPVATSVPMPPNVAPILSPKAVDP